ncbi:TPA: hypothetical protein ACS772_003770 [Providencia alcalifaciens]
MNATTAEDNLDTNLQNSTVHISNHDDTKQLDTILSTPSLTALAVTEN